jgi:hypothetical protein
MRINNQVGSKLVNLDVEYKFALSVIIFMNPNHKLALPEYWFL